MPKLLWQVLWEDPGSGPLGSFPEVGLKLLSSWQGWGSPVLGFQASLPNAVDVLLLVTIWYTLLFHWCMDDLWFLFSLANIPLRLVEENYRRSLHPQFNVLRLTFQWVFHCCHNERRQDSLLANMYTWRSISCSPVLGAPAKPPLSACHQRVQSPKMTGSQRHVWAGPLWRDSDDDDSSWWPHAPISLPAFR